jgi:hypothetical protein
MALWWRYQDSKMRLFPAYLVAEAGGWPERVAKTLPINIIPRIKILSAKTLYLEFNWSLIRI